MAWWLERMTRIVGSDERLQTRAFQFVDCLPSLRANRDIARHLAEYLDPRSVDLPKVFRAAVVPHLVPFDGMHRFYPTLARMAGFRVVEVPVSHRPRLAGSSKYGIWNRLWKGLSDLRAVRWMQRNRLDYRKERVA